MRLRLLCATSVLVLTGSLTATHASAADVGGTATGQVRGQQVAARAADPVSSVLAISIDGLNPDALRRLGVEGTPHLHDLMARGASTLNARTALELTITLPNHTGMVTSRRVDAAKGGHGVTWNDDRTSPATVQEAAGGEVSSVFTEVHAAGGSTALFATKTKFSLWDRSWPDGIDQVVLDENQGALVRAAKADFATERALRFVHISLPDKAGHAKGFMSAAYLRAVRRSDRLVGKLVKAVDADPARAASTAIVLTADHGGRGANHGVRTSLANYRIPFMVVGPGVPADTDLYALNPDYANPRKARPGYAKPRQPVRNAALGNLALELLGLGPIPGSGINADQSLDVAPVI